MGLPRTREYVVRPACALPGGRRPLAGPPLLVRLDDELEGFDVDVVGPVGLVLEDRLEGALRLFLSRVRRDRSGVPVDQRVERHSPTIVRRLRSSFRKTGGRCSSGRAPDAEPRRLAP